MKNSIDKKGKHIYKYIAKCKVNFINVSWYVANNQQELYSLQFKPYAKKA